LFENLLLDPTVKKKPKLSMELKFLGVHEPPAPYFRGYGPPSGVTLNQQCFKRHCYIVAKKLCITFLKAHFFSFFCQVNARCCSWSSAQEY